MSDVDTAGLRKSIEEGREMVRRLCNPAESGQRWIMRIPAHRDDPDLVISRALEAGTTALDALERAARIEKAAREVAIHHRAVLCQGCPVTERLEEALAEGGSR